MTQSKNPINEFFIQMENRLLKYWEEERVIYSYLNKNKSSKKTFSFQDGPITANNPMGVHHAWGRTYKDLWQKFYNLLGYRQRFQNGFDCQGLWVEVEVEKELGLKSKKDIENLVLSDKKKSIAKFVQLCKDRVYKYAKIQENQSKRLGYFMDWENSYFTMDDDNNYMIWRFLKTCYENSWIYKGHESVPWCPRCETAISQHEMLTEDYKEVVHDSIYMKFKILNSDNEYLLVWTTTPWTIPANIAVAVDVKVFYSLVEDENGDFLWMAKDIASTLMGTNCKVKKTVKGSELVNLKYKGLFDELSIVKKTQLDNPNSFHIVVATDDKIMPISTTEGTGLVHTAVSAGTEDFKLGKKLGLPMIPVIEDNATYLSHMGFLAGKNAKKHPEIIFDYLKEQEKLGEKYIFKIVPIKHRYPGCWRCKAELVWKVADEWYIAMDRPPKFKVKDEKLRVDTRTLRERMINVTRQIQWMPSFGLERELDWLKNMHDWLISKKNRYWGLSLPIYECEKCKTFEVIGSYEELQQRAVSGLEELKGRSPHKPYIDEVKISCQNCKQEISRVLDVGNPWLDAGIVPYSTIKKDNKGAPLYNVNRSEWLEWFPVNFITESFPGQFKNWFYAMIAMSTVLEDKAPFERVLGFATLTGEDGRPMHKSWGNSIAFHEGADNIGVDVMRFMYTLQNPSENLLFGYNKADIVRKGFYLILYNSFKFYNDNAKNNKVQYKKLSGVESQLQSVMDLYIISRVNECVTTVYNSLIQYDAKTASQEIENFVSDLSTWYIRGSRARVGDSNTQLSKDSWDFYKTMQDVFYKLSIAMSPFMPFISEEIYINLTQKKSVHLESWPENTGYINKNLQSDMSLVRAIAEAGHRVRKELKIKVRQPLQEVKVMVPEEQKFQIDSFEKQYETIIQQELNVKSVKILYEKSLTNLVVSYDTNISDELKLEGEVRDLIRAIQVKRKELGLNIRDFVSVKINDKYASFSEMIKKAVGASEVDFNESTALEVEKT